MKTPVQRVAVAEDHRLARKGIVEIIRSFEEFDVVLEAGDGQELLTAMYTAPRLPDICLIDINMPRMNGYETAAAISQRWPWVTIVALTMYNHKQAIAQMSHNGAHAFLLKDIHPEELRRSMLTALDRQEVNEPIAIAAMTPGEYEFLKLCAIGLTLPDIVCRMNISPHKARSYKQNLFSKLNVTSFPGLVVQAIRMGFRSRPE